MTYQVPTVGQLNAWVAKLNVEAESGNLWMAGGVLNDPWKVDRVIVWQIEGLHVYSGNHRVSVKVSLLNPGTFYVPVVPEWLGGVL